MIDAEQDYLIERVAERFRALGDENRLRLLMLLEGGERNVTSLTEGLGLRQASVSKHLAVLRRAGLVTSRRDGAQVLYRPADESIYEMCRIVCDGVVKQVRDQSEALGLAEPSGPGSAGLGSAGAEPRPRQSAKRNPAEGKGKR